MLLSALSQPRDRADGAVIMTTTPTFVMYRHERTRARSTRAGGAARRQWDLAEASMLRGIEVSPPNVIFIATPNNPTGNLVNRE